jgi:hypothetical protein
LLPKWEVPHFVAVFMGNMMIYDDQPWDLDKLFFLGQHRNSDYVLLRCSCFKLFVYLDLSSLMKRSISLEGNAWINYSTIMNTLRLKGEASFAHDPPPEACHALCRNSSGYCEKLVKLRQREKQCLWPCWASIWGALQQFLGMLDTQVEFPASKIKAPVKSIWLWVPPNSRHSFSGTPAFARHKALAEAWSRGSTVGGAGSAGEGPCLSLDIQLATNPTFSYIFWLEFWTAFLVFLGPWSPYLFRPKPQVKELQQVLRRQDSNATKVQPAAVCDVMGWIKWWKWWRLSLGIFYNRCPQLDDAFHFVGVKQFHWGHRQGDQGLRGPHSILAAPLGSSGSSENW